MVVGTFLNSSLSPHLLPFLACSHLSSTFIHSSFPSNKKNNASLKSQHVFRSFFYLNIMKRSSRVLEKISFRKILTFILREKRIRQKTKAYIEQLSTMGLDYFFQDYQTVLSYFFKSWRNYLGIRIDKFCYFSALLFNLD
jgi:hypothetical protein